MGKAKFGASNFYYGVVKDDLVADGPKKMPGLTEAKMGLKNEMKAVAADNGPYVTLSSGITEATLYIKLLDIPSEARKDFFGIDVKKGVELYNKDLNPNDIAIMFDTKMEDGTKIHVAMLKGKFSIPGVDTKTVDGTPDPNADETTGTFAPRGDAEDGMMVAIGREDNPDFDLEKFKSFVFPKTADDYTVLDTPAPEA